MADKARYGKPYVWVTWIVGLLAGTSKCEFAPWYKARFKHEKRARNDDFDSELYEIEHSKLVDEIAADLRTSGYDITTEHDAGNENAWKLEGHTVTLAGKFDIIAIEPSRDVLIVDAKGGRPQKKDVWQVRTYLYALSKLGFALRRVRGRLVYRELTVDVPENTNDEIAKIVSVAQMIALELQPPKTPSVQECEFCDIASCSERLTATQRTGLTSDF